MHEREIQIFKSEIYEKKKEHEDAMFLFKLRGSWKRRSSVLGLLNDFCFSSKAVNFFPLVRLPFISVLQGKCYFSFLLSASSVIRSEYEIRYTSLFKGKLHK